MLPLDYYCQNRGDARDYLASALRRGSLVLFLGAGVSNPIGLPDWQELVRRCLFIDGRSSTADTFLDSKSMGLAIDAIEKAHSLDGYIGIVREALYSGVVLTETVITQRLLIALGALTMASRRGSVRTVVTLNFDDVLERYWQIHGYSAQVVTGLPALLTEADVTIYHPNGYIPSSANAESSRFLVFSERSFEERLSVFETEWRSFVTQVLMSRVGLFVGLSGNDPIIGPALQDVKRKIGGSRPTGFWMLGPEPKRLSEGYFLDRNVVPLTFNNFDEYPTFLFDVCQAAATSVET